MFINTRQTYGLIAQILHWVTAILILILLMLGIYMHDLPINAATEIDDKIWLYSLHKTLGIAAFFIAFLRVVWAFIQTKPHPLNSERKYEALLAGTVHWLLYGSIILMPITGWLHHASLDGFAPIWWPFSQNLPFIAKDPDLAGLFRNMHKFIAITLIVSLVLHILGAMKHLLIDNDQTLSRMLPWKKVEFSSDLNMSENKSSARILAGSIFAILIGIYASLVSFEKPSKAILQSSPISLDGWIVDHEKSSLKIEIIQNKDSIGGKFSKWNADIIFDPEKLDKARVKVTVDTTSLIAGGIAKHALSYNFLNIAKFPQATFTSENFIQTADGKYQTEGELYLAGKTNTLILPFDLRIENGRAFMESTIELKRLDYGLGSTGYTTDEFLGFGVKVMVVLEATKS